jgi:two-component system chemotaxis sensor kinase CheA
MPLDREELMRRLTATFLEEVAEHVRVLNRELMSLEREPEARRTEATAALFRAAHSLKGAARAVNATAIALISHKLEELLIGVRDGTRELTPELFALLFATSDALAESGARFGRGVTDDPALLALGERFDELLGPGESNGEAGGLRVTPRAAVLRAPSPEEPAPAPLSEPEPGTLRHAILRSNLPPPVAAPRRDSAPAPEDPGVVRVPRRRLDRLVAESAELRAARSRFEARSRELADLDELVQRLRNEFASTRKALNRENRRRVRKRAAANGAAANGAGANGNAAANGNGAASHANGSAAAVQLPARALRLIDRGTENLARVQQGVEAVARALREDQRALARAAEPLELEILRLRMDPFRELGEYLERLARDLSFAESKPIEFSIEGGEIELDRGVLERLKAPLAHLLRNAIDHGIEPSGERRGYGKPERGRVAIRVTLRGEVVQIEIQDDGRGLDLGAIRGKAGAAAAGLSDRDLVRLIFGHGFSTAKAVTEISGRGVGLDVVKTELEAINGRVDVESEPRRGARFVLELPPTLSRSRVLFVNAGGERFALPCTSIESLLRVEAKALRILEGKPAVLVQGTPLPVVMLARILELGAPSLDPEARLPLVVLSVRGRRVAVGVDELIAQDDVLLKPLGRRLRRVRGVSSAIILPDGRLCLVLNPQELLAAALELPEAPGFLQAAQQAPTRRRLLLADDSLTTRTLERNILESAGYEVMTASDGRAALELLEKHGADLVLSDVEMPEMDGLGLVSAIRASARFRATPVILLTALDAPDHRQRGLDAGADAYLVKGAFDQTRLLDTIRQLL